VNAPLLAAITLNPTGGGIAAVSTLLWRVFEEQWGSKAQLHTMFEHESRPATLAEKARFTMSLSRVEAAGRTDWILFTHLGLARVQTAIPAPMRQRYGVFLHGIEAWKPLRASEQDALANASLRLANSRYTADRVLAMNPGVGPIEVCPLALPVPSNGGSASPDAALTSSLGRHVVLVVGRLMGAERYKGHDQLIEAWPCVVARVPDAQLVIVGGGDDAPRLVQKAAESPVAARILFTGFLTKVTLDECYRRAAIFALPSRGEGFGLVYLEAMAHRLACVGSVHDAAREVIVDGRTGRLVNQDDPTQLADTLVSLLLDETLRRQMGEAGHTRLLCEYSFSRFSERLRALLPTGPGRNGH
jgi:phosphatidyl-myo-inositol dimannoside synthase